MLNRFGERLFSHERKRSSNISLKNSKKTNRALSGFNHAISIPIMISCRTNIFIGRNVLKPGITVTSDTSCVNILSHLMSIRANSII